jgi:hypothetical protein
MEILAHISAPATKEDDHRAEKRLQSYLGFQPVRVTNCSGSTGIHKNVIISQREKHPASSFTDRSSKRPRLGAHISDASNRDITESAKHLSTTDLNVISVEYQTPHAASATSFARAKFSYKGEYTSNVTTTSSVVKLEMAQERWEAAQVFVANVKDSSKAEVSILSDSQFENTQEAMSMLQDSLVTALESQSSQIGADCKSNTAQVSVETTHAAGTSSGREFENTRTMTWVKPDSIADLVAGRSFLLEGTSCSSKNFDSGNISSLPRVIRSPPQFGTVMRSEGAGVFMTETLQKVMSYPDLAQNYQPMKHIRDIQPSERGYWRIDTLTWTRQRQFDFWTFLNDLVSKGRAGMGTECFRNVKDDGSDDNTALNHLGTVRVYCWGELIKHIWLLCHLGSGGALKNKQTTWISAVYEKPIVYMP